MTNYYSYSSLKYSLLTIIIRWCVFYCLWNLWTLPRLESSNGLIDVSIRAPGNNTRILQESLPVRIINGHKTVLISGLLETTADDSSIITETMSSTKLQASYGVPLVQISAEPQAMPKSQYNNQKPPLQRRFSKTHRVLTPSQMPNEETQERDHATNSNNAMSLLRQRKLHSKSVVNARRLKALPRVSNLGESAAPSFFDQQEQQEQKSTFVLIAFSCALIGGGLLAVRSMKRLKNWAIRSQEDNLAYDIDYTSRSESSYGSFDSHFWQDDLNKFDV